MELTFRAEKMLNRVKKEGREHLLDDATMELIKRLDGKKGNDYNWQSVVNFEDVVYIAEEDVYVARCDCD